MIVESRPGAGTGIATETVSRAAPDGNTLLFVAPAFVVNPHFRKLNYDPLTSFEPIFHLASSPIVIVVNNASPYRTFADLLAALRASLIANSFLADEVERLTKEVSVGFARGRISPARRAGERLNRWRGISAASKEDT